MAIIQRPPFDGVPREEAVWWTLRNEVRGADAVCRMLTHPIGHELWLEVRGSVEQARVCQTDEEVLSCQEYWRAALEKRGWRAAHTG